MADPFIGEIRLFTGNFAPRGWAFCNGALLPIAQNAALFSIVGTTYGGDGRVSFGLPDLRGRLPVHAGGGAGPGLTVRTLGERGGVPSVTLVEANLPVHAHAQGATRAVATDHDPSGLVLAEGDVDVAVSAPGAAAHVAGAPLAPTGGGQPHENQPPSLAVNFIIALQGIFPPRG